MKKEKSVQTIVLVLSVLILPATWASAQTYALLADFTYTNGSDPIGDPVIDTAGNVFGTAQTGSPDGCGVVYELVNNGGGSYTHNTIYNFAGGSKDGCDPYGGLMMDSSGDLYGTTVLGGSHSAGVVYELVNSSGTYKESVLYNFRSGSDGAYPYGDLAMDAGGHLYGTTYNGGGGGCTYGCGTVFQLYTLKGAWKERVLHNFSKNAVDGWYPGAGVTLNSKGAVYGTTTFGGASGFGSVFGLTPPTKKQKRYSEKVLHSFGGTSDGCYPYSGLISDSSGNLYGTTSRCGQYNYGTAYQLEPSAKSYAVIFQWNGTDGYWPYENAGHLAVDTTGNIYGTTDLGGAYGYGTVFALAATTFTFTDVHDFDYKSGDGVYPSGGVSLDSSGNLYGTTIGGGSQGYGTVWQISSP